MHHHEAVAGRSLTSSVQIPNVIDATRRSDQFLVSIKSTMNDTRELHIASYLTEKRSDRNHCVPILDHFTDTRDAELDYIIMPLLRNFNDPEFYSIREATEFIHQVLEVSIHFGNSDGSI